MIKILNLMRSGWMMMKKMKKSYNYLKNNLKMMKKLYPKKEIQGQNLQMSFIMKKNQIKNLKNTKNMKKISYNMILKIQIH